MALGALWDKHGVNGINPTDLPHVIHYQSFLHLPSQDLTSHFSIASEVVISTYAKLSKYDRI